MRTRIGAALLLAASIIFYFAGQRKNPPGFFADESSIAWNALEIARHGADEHGVRFPLYFAAFGEYKNPTYIYALAGVFKVFSPSNVVARRFSALLGFLACVTLGALAWRISRSRFVTVTIFLTALFTPMLFEISRLAFEVALYPLATALFLLCVFNASQRVRWSAFDIASITIALLLLTYTYSIGRLFAPLLALTLFVFYTRERRSQLIAIGALFTLLGILPVIVFNRTHEGALTLRFRDVSYADVSKPIETLAELEQHYVDNLLPIGMTLRGDPNQRHHVAGGGGSMLGLTFVLALWSAAACCRHGLRQLAAADSTGDGEPSHSMAQASLRTPWCIFVIIGTLLSLLPASLTIDRYHTLRLAPYPIFLIVLSIPALRWLRRKHAGILLVIGAIQVVWFFSAFYRYGGRRHYEFDNGAKKAVDTAIAQNMRPIYVEPGLYVHAWWYGAQRGVDKSAFVLEEPQTSHAIVISGHGAPAGSIVLSDEEGWTVYVSR